MFHWQRITKNISLKHENLSNRLVNENMSNLNVDWVKGVLRHALEVWSDETPLNFLELDNQRVDIEVGFSRY